jgi:uncharacterized protein YbbK (DUF523 family)
MEMEEKIKIGISRCLLGDKVRYDGGHQWDRYLTDTLGKYLSFVPVCPEVECGLGVPREPMRLEGDPNDPKLVTLRSRVDYTERMRSGPGRGRPNWPGKACCGFIFKSGSPSSGMERVKIYGPKEARPDRESAFSPGPSWIVFPCCRWRTKGDCTIRN